MLSRLLHRGSLAARRNSGQRFRAPNLFAKRNLNIHEYHAKELFQKNGIRIGNGFVASTPSEARANAQALGGERWVVKSQVLAGGRGKGWFKDGFKGGVHIAKSLEEVEEYAGKMLGNTLYTKQCNEAQGGRPVQKVLIDAVLDFHSEFYFSILLDRSSAGPAMIGSPAGGVNIEEVAAKSPEKIKTTLINKPNGITSAQCEEMAKFMGLTDPIHIADMADQIEKMYEFFVKHDCTQLEINPLVQGKDGFTYILDAKVNFDDSAEFRQKEIFALKDSAQEDAREVLAAEVDINYVGLDGNIGCLVNGAGLAMATMDIISYYGGDTAAPGPANFLDVGGGATEKQVTQAFELILSDSQVKGILVNIFGGIMQCDTIASGIVAATKTLDLAGRGIPLVVRLSGTHVMEGNKILEDSGLMIEPAIDMDEAAQDIVALIKEGPGAERLDGNYKEFRARLKREGSTAQF